MRQYIGLVTGIIALLLAIIAFSTGIFDVSVQTEQFRIFVVIVYVVFGIGVVIAAYKSKSVFRAWAILGVLYVITAFFFIWVGSWRSVVQDNQELMSSNNALKEIQKFDFEEKIDATDISPWYMLPDTKNHTLVISEVPEFSRSGNKSLRLKLNIQSISSGEDEYGGIALTDAVFPALTNETVNAIEAWILIPDTEQTENIDFQSHIMAFTYDKNGAYLGLYSEDVELNPGKWTPVFLGVDYEVYIDPKALPLEVGNEEFHFSSENRKINEFYLTVWSDAPYSGSIYFDDVVMYTVKTSE